MSIEEYRRKRTFARTPEPAPEAPGAADGPSFCVQRHAASHLHYDLRLEIGGVLKSWAVPKGPTLDPSARHMAILVEDHPLAYGAFEGVIPPGNYGAGSVLLWDRGTYEPLGPPAAEQFARGDFKFRLHGEKLRGDFALVRLKGAKYKKGNEWLLLKKKDRFAQPGWDPNAHAVSVRSGLTQEEIGAGGDPPAADPLPGRIEPMKASIGVRPPAAGDWIYEVKWDGVRAIGFLGGGSLRLVSRNGHSLDAQYPEIHRAAGELAARTAVVDGEIVALDERGLPSFCLLQQRMHVRDAASVAKLQRSVPVVFYLFDLLYLDGRDLRDRPLLERKALLKDILRPGGALRYSEHFADGAALFAAAKRQGLEGVVGKRSASLYQSRRSADWVKYKATRQQEFVLCGYTPGERDCFGALVLGVQDGGRLRWAGNVGTGFDQAALRALFERMQPLRTAKSPLAPDPGLPKEVTWVKPELVCEVKFAAWTRENRLRAPVFLGLRDDADPRDCVREEPAAEADPPAFLPPGPGERIVAVEGRRLKFTNLSKVFWPAEGYTKRDLINYYDAVAPLLVPHLKDRPLSLKRYPDGIAGDFFFQKEVAESFPAWLRTEVADGIRHVIGEDRATLLFLANLACIDHNPWMSRMASLAHPDFLLIDLDPQDCPYPRIVEAALLLRRILDRLELASYPKTTGGDGMHLYVPLEPVYTYEQVRSFAELLSHLAVTERPDLFTTPRAVARRARGRVYFDWAQIARGKTISAPYSVRPHPGATVATPLAWREVTARLTPEQFTMRNVLPRFERLGDLFAPVLKQSQRLEPALERLPALLVPSASRGGKVP
jgi:bifunctional non-homologous end joining protein LigD